MRTNPFKSKLFLLFVPIFLETFFLMLSGIVDSAILSSVSDDAVAAVGTSNTYLSIFFLLFSIISSGLLAVMAQYIGADKKGVAFQARQLAIVLNTVIGVTISVSLGLTARFIVEGLGVSESLREDAIIYLRIVGAGSLLDALIPVFSCYLRAFDKTKYSLAAAFSGNLVNLGLDALFVFAFKWGVTGAAVATLIGKGVNISLCLIFGYIKVKGLQYQERVSRKLLFKQIVKIGLPAAIETAVYSLAMAAVVTFLNRLDSDGFNAKARTYANQITTFSYCVAFAIAQANVIICGWNIGRNDLKGCYPSTKKAGLIGIVTGILLELVFALLSPWILRLFTNDEALIRMVRIVLFIDIALEIGRTTNLVYGQVLKSTGDSIFPMYVSVIVSAIFAIGGSFLFGTIFNMGVIGAYIGLTLDEVIRAAIMIIRWLSGKWEKHVIIKSENQNA